MCWNGNTFPFFLFEGQRVVEPFPTGIQITDKIPAGSHGLFPPGFLFRLSLRSGRHGLGRSCGLQSPLASAFLPHIFSVACSLPGRRATVRRFPFYTFCTTASPPALSPSAQRFGRVRFNIFRSASRDFGVRLLQRPLRPVAAGLRS